MALTTLRRAMNPSTSLVRAVIALCAACGGASDGENAVTTDVAVHTTAIVRATLHRYVTAYGYVDPAPVLIGTPSAGALLSPISPGVIAEIRVAEGQRVARGTVLFRLDSRSADVAVQRAERDVAFAEQVAVRQRQ